MITAMTTKKARKRLSLSALVFATRVFAVLAAGTLLFSTLTGCEQEASSYTTQKGQLTVNDTPAGVYVANIYTPIEGLPSIFNGAWDTDIWAKATAISQLAASGVVRTDGGKAVIPLNTPDGEDFTGNRTFLAVISPASPHDTPQYKHYSITDFTAGRQAVNWKPDGINMSYVYTITFHTDGSSFYLEVPLNGKVLKPELEQTQAGYDFDGWYWTKADGTEAAWDFDKDTVKGNITLYGTWKQNTRTVTFDLNGAPGTAPTHPAVPSGSTITPPSPPPTRTGWGFVGWYRNAEGTGEAWDFVTNTVTSNLTLYAHWTPIYTVTFDLHGAPAQAPTQTAVLTCGTITDPPKPTRTGWGFVGWYRNAEGTGTKWNFSTNTVKENITLYAKWTKRSYTVTFRSNYGSDAEYDDFKQTVKYEELVKKPYPDPAPPRTDGYTLDGWYRNAAGTGDAWNFDTDTVTGNLTLYARWTPIYTVTFDLNGAPGQAPRIRRFCPAAR
jgi:uncharacterized repeat protein (TIGR02543 family)